MAEDIRLSVGADTTQMESQIANAARKATVVIRPTIDSKGLEKISAPLGRITGQADEFTKSMEAANARVLAFGASVGVLNAVAKSFQNIVTASTQVEASLKEIQVATGETTGNLERLGKGIFEVARSTGLSFKQASEATLEFARQGGTLEDSLMKAKAALVLTRTTGLDAAEAVKGLTAAVLSFNQVGLDYETVVNKLAAVDTKFAVSSRDLIEGISRSASVAQEAGVSFDELTALITTLQEKTARGGAVIGNALKTIFQRVQTTENLDYIRNLGIAVNDVSGDILPATTIIKKLADEFQNLDSATRKGLLIKIGGGFQIDKLAALLNDISNANGTFNRSLQQSTNAGNQGFQKLEELNKTVQASFDRLTTSGTQFAATIGKVAFSDDFRSILNKTSSFLESLNESISGGEEGGATIGKAIVKGIGSIITGPGALLIAGLGIKLFGDLAKFGVDSLKNQLGVTNVKKEQQDIEKSILGLLLQNTAVQNKIVSLEGNKAAQAEYLLGLYSKQAATLEKMSKLSKDIGPSVYEGGIRLTEEGTKNVKAKTAAGGYMSKDAARRMEMQEAPAGAFIKEISNFNFGPKEGRGTMIVNSMESVHKTPMGDFVIPSYSKTRTGKPTLFSASGYVPNFAEKQEEEQKANLLRSLTIDGGAYSFAGLTIGGTGSKNIRSKELNSQLLSKIKDPALASALSKYNKLNFSNVSVGNIYRRRDQNLDSLEAGEEQIKDHFIKKANSALSPQIGSFIKDELDFLGIKPTASMQYAIKSGKKFDFVNESMAGSFFETMLKLANMSASDENFGQFFNDSNSSFDIYGLKPDIAEQYGLPKRFWEYVEIKSSEKALNDELGTKFITQLSQSGGESLKAKFLTQAKTGSKGYVPNFFKRKISSLKKSQSAGNLGFYYDDGSEKQNNDDYLQSGNVKINRKKNKKNAEQYRKQASDLIESARNTGNYSYIKNIYGPYISDKFEYNKVLDKKIKGNSLGGLISNLQGAIAEKNFHDELSSYIKEENFNAGIDFYSRDSKRLVEIKARQTALTQGEANAKVLAFLGSRGKGRKNNKSESLDDLLNNIDFTVYESNYKTKTASRGYVPNFAGTTNFEGSASRFGYKIGQVYNQGEEAIKSTFDNPKTAFGGTRTGEAAYRTKYGFKLDEKGIIASILGNNTFVAGKDQRQELEILATRLSAQGATMKGSQNMLGLNISRLNTRPENVISANIKGKFKKIDYEKLDKVFPRFWKSKGLGQVWENSKLYATYTGANNLGGLTGSPHVEILKNPEVRKLIERPNLARENNALLRKSAVEAVLKKDPSIAGFLVDLAGSSEEEYLRGTKEKSGISYAMPFSGSPFSDIESVGVKKDAVERAKQERKINETKKAFRERGVLYREFVKNKSEFLKYGKWGGDGYYKNGIIYLQPDANKTAAKGYIPNFSQKAILDAIGREQKESGLPLSAIKVVQDARVRGPQNPSGYAVINNRDEPDGRVPNFSDPPKTDPPQIRQDLFNAIEEALGRLENSTKSLDESFARIATNLGTSAETVVQVLDKITTSGNAAAESTQKATESGKKNTDQDEKDTKDKKASKEKEQKTVQDSLYTLLKWQTVIAGVTGALSTFGGDIAKGSEAVGSIASAYVTLRESTGLRNDFLGKNKEGKQNTLKDAFSGKIEGKTKMESIGAGIGAVVSTGGAYIAAGVTAVQALDSAIQIMAGTSKKSENAMLSLVKAQERYSVSLTETQKKIQEQIGERFNVSGAGIGGFLNQIGTTGLFRGQQTKSIKEIMGGTGFDENTNRGIAMDISSLFLPQVQRELGEKAKPKEISDEVIKRTLDLIQKAQIESRRQLTPSEITLTTTPSEIARGKLDPELFRENLQKRRMEQEEPSKKAENDQKLYKESFLYSSKYLAIQLDTSAELLKIQNSITSSEENLLKFKKDNVRTSEAEKMLIDYKLQKLESERNLRSDIQQAVLKGAQEEVNAFKNRKGNVTQEEADLINKLYENLAKAAAEGQNVGDILNEFVVQLNKVDEGNQKFIGSLAQIGKGLDSQVGVLKARSNAAQEEFRRGQLLGAINAKISYEYNAQKQFLMDKIAIQQKGLDIAREEAGLARNIRDKKFDISLIGKTPRQQQIAQLQRQASGITRQDELKDLQNTRSQAALTARSKLIQSILEKDTTVNPQDLENLSQQNLKTKFINASTLKGGQLDTTIDQLSKGGDAFIGKAITAGDNLIDKAGTAGETLGETLGEALAKKLGIPSVQQPSTFGQYPHGLRPPEKDNNSGQTGTPTGLPAETQTDLNRAREIAEKNAKSRAEMEYNRILSESALPRNKEEDINTEDLARRLKALNELDSITTFSGGMRQTMASINDEVESFGNTLGKEIPMNFRNGLVDAMKALSDPNATTSLKERLMGVAAAFLNKINEAFMMQTANQITRGIFGNGQPGTGLAGSLGFASGGPIEGGSGTKDDVPAMLMGGEYVIKKNIVNKYGRDFFDRLNSGKMKGFANGGLATFDGFKAADLKDTVVNSTNYVPYGQAKMGGLSFDENGMVIGMDSYTGDEQGKQNALMQAQTNFYSQMAQSGQGGFFMPGKYGQGAIVGQQNLLAYASQDTIGTQFDKFSSMGNMAEIDIAGGSSSLSLFALRDQGNLRNAEYIESKNKALDLYLGGVESERQKYTTDEENRKQYEEDLKQYQEQLRKLEEEKEQAIKQAKQQSKRQIQGALIQAGLSIAMSAIGSAMSQGWASTAQASGGKATFMQKLGGAFTGGTMTNAAGVSETRGGLFNMFSSSGYKDFGIIGNLGGGLQQWNSGLGKYTPMGGDQFGMMYQPYQEAGRLSYDAFGSPVIGGPLPTGPSAGPSFGFNFSKLNPMNWFSRGGARASITQMSNIGGFNPNDMGFSGITEQQAFPSPIGSDSVVGMSWSERQQLINSQRTPKSSPTIYKAAGGTVQGNGMGDNVPAMLNGGEFVMSRQAAQKIGYNNLQQMNSNPQDSGSDITSRIEAKLEELFDKVSGVGTINISVTSSGKDEKESSEQSSNQDQQNKELARKMKEVVLNVLRDEKRLGGLLR